MTLAEDDAQMSLRTRTGGIVTLGPVTRATSPAPERGTERLRPSQTQFGLNSYHPCTYRRGRWRGPRHRGRRRGRDWPPGLGPCDVCSGRRATFVRAMFWPWRTVRECPSACRPRLSRRSWKSCAGAIRWCQWTFTWSFGTNWSDSNLDQSD